VLVHICCYQNCEFCVCCCVVSFFVSHHFFFPLEAQLKRNKIRTQKSFSSSSSSLSVSLSSESGSRLLMAALHSQLLPGISVGSSCSSDNKFSLRNSNNNKGGLVEGAAVAAVSQTWFTGRVSEHWHSDAFRLFSRYVCGFVSLLPILLFATFVFFSFLAEVYYQMMKTSKPFAMREFQNSTGFSGFIFPLPMRSVVFLQSLLQNDEHFKTIGNERVSEFNWFWWLMI
jgi:hypothetical protein